ncbi:TetR/AcrR family transcriptional regulator C-terminal domain-containing protein [Plantactinospora sp. GCM10030261]|uniref:TetR/AcrR family transcriptional regulator C-terminal domain-containing protein n=1 Tax=Plantactinospora sp. GCM10030261 TaxID=3273420 RepID=UPI003608CFE7
MTGPTDPPYRRIVAELRRQILAGELAPGDRAPSVRRVARDWGVALATATRAMATLREEGYLRARPRVGTVVADRAGKPVPRDTSPGPRRAGRTEEAGHPARPGRAPARRPGRPPDVETDLTRDRVVRAAIEIADAEGLTALSMRGVATRLDIATMSTYRHVASKEDLVLLMADAAFGEQGYPPPHPTGWRARIERAARTMWTLHRKHPWLAQIGPLTRPLPLTNLLMHGEQILGPLQELGFAPVARLDLQVLIYSYVQGLAVHLEWEIDAQARSGLSGDEYIAKNAPDLDRIATSGLSPAFTRLMSDLGPDGYDLDLDRLFELGLRALLDGVAQQASALPPATACP